jgi:hypothetical protein
MAGKALAAELNPQPDKRSYRHVAGRWYSTVDGPDLGRSAGGQLSLEANPRAVRARDVRRLAVPTPEGCYSELRELNLPNRAIWDYCALRVIAGIRVMPHFLIA